MNQTGERAGMNLLTRAFDYGSQWVRVDFHLHTRADREFVDKGEASDFVPRYVDRLLAEKVQVGVVTNHNKFDLDEYERLAAHAENRGVFLLPGVELAVGDGASGVHVLVVFSPQWLSGEDRISRFISSQFKDRCAHEYQTENARSSRTLTETVDDLDGCGLPYFLVFAHEEEPKGLWRELFKRLDDWNRPGFAKVRARTLGFQKVRTIDHAEAGRPDRAKVKEKLGEAYPAEVEGSDPKSMEEIGRGRQTYLKIGAFSFEAIRFALEFYRERVAAEPPVLTHSHVRAIHFSGGLLDGKTVRLSPHLNTLIGIRGSGKSALVECLRFVLQLPVEDTAADARYKRDLVAQVLGSGGKVTLEAVDRYGQVFRVSRILGNRPEVYRGDELQPAGIDIGAVIVRKPLCFGQKELSARGERSEQDLLERLIGPKLVGIRARIEAKKREIRLFWASEAERSSSLDRIQEVEREIGTIETQLSIYDRLQIGEKLQERVDLDHDHLRLENADVNASRFVAACSRAYDEAVQGLMAIESYEPKREPAFWTAFKAEYGRFLAVAASVKGSCDAVAAAYEKVHAFLGQHEALIAAQNERFAAIERQLSGQLSAQGHAMVRPDEYVRLKKKLAYLRQERDELDRARTARAHKREALRSHLSALQELYRQEYQCAENEIGKINAGSATVKIECDYRGDREAFREHLVSSFRGSGIKGSVFQRLVEKYADFAQLLEDEASVRALLGERADAFFTYVRDQFLDLILWQVPNKTTILFRGKPLADHSLGQRASALILFVMSMRENDLLVIDQPEDDLDSQTIYEDVIKLILELKPGMQFVFATHNANIPVLGDAEQIVACSFDERGMSFEEGSVDVRKMQQNVVGIMEGGREAFAKRKEIYGQWNEAR